MAKRDSITLNSLDFGVGVSQPCKSDKIFKEPTNPSRAALFYAYRSGLGLLMGSMSGHFICLDLWNNYYEDEYGEHIRKRGGIKIGLMKVEGDSVLEHFFADSGDSVYETLSEDTVLLWHLISWNHGLNALEASEKYNLSSINLAYCRFIPNMFLK